MSLLIAALCCFSLIAARGDSISAQKTSTNQVRVSWPGGLNLVQPQKATNLTANAWADFGAALTGVEIIDSLTSVRAFYRLRFLPPAITSPPQSQTSAVGGNATFNVLSSGTAPFIYQWRRNGTNLVGQTNASVAFTNLTAADAGDLSVVIANRVGSITSIVATLTVAGPVVAPRGIFMGNFSGQTNGGLAVLVTSNKTAIVLGHNPGQSQSAVATNVALSANSGFTASLGQGASIAVTFSPDAMSGTLVATNGSSGAFTGTRKSDTGVHQSNAGFYAGSFTGLLTGSLNAIMAADGTTFAHLASPIVSGGAFGNVDAANNFAATATYTLPGAAAPSMIVITAKLNPATHQFVGNYGLPGLTLGTFTLTRVATP